ncbi:MAG TPA: carbohydrate porin [Pseudomonas sp.]|uniref:carbohydrate porin n=1 Tax=Pseudomonas sp. TaxID=306 RepID=UPI002B487C90|nr:carbohydrate porin [Pseudomonas sp.]HKS14150.1 carbohydrate porin [Pseudomonas sp.]
MKESRPVFSLCPMITLLTLSLGMTAACAEEPFAAGSRWMTGDWDGARQTLLEQGYDLTLNYTNELGWNADGGFNQDRKVTYADDLLFGLGVDLQRTFGWEDASLQLYITNRNGEDITNQRLIDPRSGQLTSTQEVWGRGSIWRLAELSYRQKFLDDRLSLRAGRFGLGEFGEFPCDFQNLLFCGNTGGSSTGTVWYNFPVSQWGLQLKYQLTAELAVQAAVFEQNPSLQSNDSGFKMSFSGGKGVIMPVEAIYTTAQGLRGLPAEVRLGAFVSTADADDVYMGADGQPQPLTPEGGYERHSTSHGFWTVLRQQVALVGNDPDRPVELFTQAHFNQKDTSYIRSSLNVGMTIQGPFDSRPSDQLGIALGRVEVSPRFEKRQALLNAMSGIGSYDDPGFIPVQDKEYSAEVFYGVQATKWLMVRPNLQYVRHPGGVDEVDDAVVVGLKIQTRF